MLYYYTFYREYYEYCRFWIAALDIPRSSSEKIWQRHRVAQLCPRHLGTVWTVTRKLSRSLISVTSTYN